MRIASLVLAIALSLGACSKNAPVVIPGAVNSFDSITYDALNTAQAAIEQAKVSFANTPSMKAPIDKAIAAYDVAQAAFASYHQAALAGNSTPASQAAMQTQVNQVQSAVAALAQPKP